MTRPRLGPCPGLASSGQASGRERDKQRPGPEAQPAWRPCSAAPGDQKQGEAPEDQAAVPLSAPPLPGLLTPRYSSGLSSEAEAASSRKPPGAQVEGFDSRAARVPQAPASLYLRLCGLPGGLPKYSVREAEWRAFRRPGLCKHPADAEQSRCVHTSGLTPPKPSPEGRGQVAGTSRRGLEAGGGAAPGSWAKPTAVLQQGEISHLQEQGGDIPRQGHSDGSWWLVPGACSLSLSSLMEGRSPTQGTGLSAKATLTWGTGPGHMPAQPPPRGQPPPEASGGPSGPGIARCHTSHGPLAHPRTPGRGKATGLRGQQGGQGPVIGRFLSSAVNGLERDPGKAQLHPVWTKTHSNCPLQNQVTVPGPTSPPSCPLTGSHLDAARQRPSCGSDPIRPPALLRAGGAALQSGPLQARPSRERSSGSAKRWRPPSCLPFSAGDEPRAWHVPGKCPCNEPQP